MKSITAKLTVLNLVCALLAVAVLYVLMDRQLTNVMNDRFVNQGQTVAAAMAKSVEPFLVNHDLTSIQSAVDQVVTIQDVEWAYVMAPDGRVLAHTFVPQFPDGLQETTRHNKGAWVVTLPNAKHQTTVFSKPVLTGIVGSVHVGFSSENLSASIHRLEWLTLLSILAVMLVSTASVAVVSATVMAPVKALTRAAETIGEDARGEFQSLPVKTNDEIGVLTRTFNHMVAEIRHDRETLEERVQRRTVELAARTAHLNSLIETTPLGIVVLDSSGKMEMCNPAFEHLFQHSQAEIRGMDLNAVIAPGDLFAEADGVSKRLRTGRSIHIATRRLRKDASLVDVEIDCVPLVAEGKHTGSFFLYQDVSERKKQQDELLAAKETAEAATRAKSEFLANMSHEIRTPMNGIIGMTELALDTELSAEQRDYLTMVKSSADALLTLINDILDFSKIEAGRMDLSPIDFNLRDALGDTVKIMALRAHQKNLELTCDIPSTMPECLVGDPDRLKQIIVNLLGNALKFTEKGEVGVKVEEESRAADHVLLHFQITDTGIGIPLNKQRLIFEAFSQADSSTTRHYGGTGLGLTISARLVEMMNGTIWVESQPGVGSVFHFTARFGTSANKPQGPSPTLNEIEGLPVLVVDDNATNRRILSEVLKNWQMVPDLVDSGQAAIAAMETAAKTGGSHALILLDCQMPGMGGFDLAAHLRSNPTLTSAPILMLTSAGVRGDAERCRKLGISGYLTKPIKQSELLTAILRVLGNAKNKEVQADLVTKHKPESNRRSKRNILLAEDNAVNAKLATRLLEKQGHASRLAVNGKEAVAAFLADPFDLVLMDVQMPEMDGFEATRLIRENEAASGGHIPIIALTAHAMVGDRERCLAAGMDGYLTKPIRPAELEQTLSEHLKDDRPPDGGESNRSPSADVEDPEVARV